MAWWKTDNQEWIGDGPLDAAEDFLFQIAQEYLDEQGRKPTLKEILHCLAVALENGGEDFASDSEKVLVTAIEVKTKKRGRKQVFKPGHVFSFPLGDGFYGFGRVTPNRGFFEFFPIKSQSRLPVKTLRSLLPIHLPSLVDTKALDEGEWKIIGQMPFGKDEFRVYPFRTNNQLFAMKRLALTALLTSAPNGDLPCLRNSQK